MMTAHDPKLQTASKSVDKDLFRAAASHWGTGVAVITTIDPAGRPYGFTASSVTSLSLEPLQFLVCVDNKATSLPAMMESGRFCINLLATGQEDVARLCASKRTDKFENFPWTPLADGLPVIDGVLAHVACDVEAVHEGGDHQIFIGGVRNIAVRGGDPLMYFRGSFGRFV